MSQAHHAVGESVDVQGISTHYHRAGSGPTVLLIHGSGPGTSAMAWRFVLPELANRFDVVAPDLVGFGNTDRPEGFQYNLANWRDHVLGLADALELQEFSVVGFSLGGAIAASMAVHQPGRIARLILMGSAGLAFTLTEGADAVWAYTPSLENMKALLKRVIWNERLANNREMAEMLYESSIRPGVYEAFTSMFPVPRQTSLDRLATPEDQLRQITAPTLIVHGREDQIVPLETSRRFHALIDNSQLHVYGRCGHLALIERASEFSRLAADFLG